MTTRRKLREELTTRLVPLLRQRGFEGPERIAGNALFHDFRRPPAAGVDVLSILFDKYQRPRCVFNVWVEPPDGLDALVRRSGTWRQGRVQPRGGASTTRWFRADRPWWQRLLGNTATREREAVSEAITILDEIDRWWTVQETSPHISTHTISYRRATLPRRYIYLTRAVGWAGLVVWAPLVMAFMYVSRSALGLPLGAGPLAGSWLKLIAWIGLVVGAMLAIFPCAMILVRASVALLMLLTGRFTIAEAKAYARSWKYPERWFQYHDV